ncbi:MAG: MoaD/ThiS family protein [Desulfobacterales bacterium]|jgi:sulfur carrier protein ThiS|nr:MoaD/ThiS family protein [Desulfobacteraceae bacterium]MDD3990925.1 MoaD/ThiS family protein [Desulfobacteraceae bacterium]MDY0312015.1 MoaD/ThiS family protein [Desulfobacterales bacterium]
MVRIGDELEISWTEGMTVGDLVDRVPGGRDCAAVRVNGRIVARPNFHRTPVPDGAQVYLVPMIVGG